MPGRTRHLALSLGLLVVAGCAASPAPSPAGPAAASPPAAHASHPSAPPTPISRQSATVAEIDRLQAAVTTDPTDANAQRELGSALLQRVRETADPSLYAPAGAAFDRALAVAPDDPLVLVGLGTLQLGKHDFATALETARRAITLGPRLAVARAIEVDALVELGRYDEAGEAAAAMLGLASDLSTLTRVSYLAELHGKLDVAVTAMRAAAASKGAAPENVAFADAQLGNLLAWTADRAGAAKAYDEALELVPDHGPSLAGKARLAVAAGRLEDAIALLHHAADVVPLPEYIIALADAETAAGRSAEAARNVALARAEIQLFQAAGVMVDLDLALFEADHGDPARALSLAQAAYRTTPTVRAADALAWAFHRLGRDGEAKPWSDKALHLGSLDPAFRYHAGAIAAALGDAKTARRDLQLALSTDAGFSATGAAEARRLLDSLGD